MKFKRESLVLTWICFLFFNFSSYLINSFVKAEINLDNSDQKNVDSKYKENNNLIEKNISQEKNIFLEQSFYIIGPGDLLQLNLFDAPELSGELKVLNDGSVPFPLIGNQFISNMTLEQAKDFIQNKYRIQLLRPELQLTIKIPRPIRVSVVGEIERPGIYSLTNNNFSQIEGSPQLINSGLPTVIDAIQKAGGINQNANLREIRLSRRLPGKKNNFKSTNLNILSTILNGNQNQNLYLFDGDILNVTTAKEDTRYLKKISQTNISPKTISVNIVGQVNNPGEKEIMANTPLVQAIYMAGGPIDWKANKSNIELIRVNTNGSVSKKKFKIKLGEDVSYKNNPPLMNQDIVFVRSNSLNKINSSLGVLSESISPAITALTLFKLLD